jgi:uncharacterized protein (UPF0335 family)
MASEQPETNKEKEFIHSEIQSTLNDIDNLIKLIALRKKDCDDMENETRYLKEYVGSFITMGDMKK